MDNEIWGYEAVRKGTRAFFAPGHEQSALNAARKFAIGEMKKALPFELPALPQRADADMDIVLWNIFDSIMKRGELETVKLVRNIFGLSLGDSRLLQLQIFAWEINLDKSE